jgi:GNAT superfamily N-acetyltransferase
VISIQPISAAETWPIRHKVMWPDQPLDYIKLKEDENGLHFGLFEVGQLVSIVSLFIAGNKAQFRKLATLSEFQGNGFASELIKHLIGYCEQNKLEKLWCNARSSKMEFYQKFGFEPTEKQFTKLGEDYIIMGRVIHF